MERYEAYKDSGVEWIGEIPANWELRRLKLLGSTRSGMGNKKPDDFGSGKPFLSYKDVYSRESFYDATGLVESTQDDRNKFSVERGDAFFTGSSETIEELGFSSVCLSTVPDATFNSFTIRFRPTGNGLWPEFSAYLFRSDVFRGYLRQRDNSITRANLSQQILGDAITVLPPLQEQRAIADYLDAKTAEIDALVADCEREVGLLREYRKAVISEAVTKGLDPDAPMKDSGVEWIGAIPKTWSMAKVKSCCDILPGYAFKSELFIQESDSVKLLRGINLGVNVIRWDEVVSYPLDEIEELGTYRLLAGDVVIGLDRPWIKEGLRIAIIQDEIFEQYLVQRVARLRGSSELDVCFVKYALESGLLEYELDSLTTGVSVPHISTEQIGSTRIALPDIATQHEIVTLLDIKTAEIDSLIEAKQQMADKLRKYRRSLISEAVTGKFKVPGI